MQITQNSCINARVCVKGCTGQISFSDGDDSRLAVGPSREPIGSRGPVHLKAHGIPWILCNHQFCPRRVTSCPFEIAIYIYVDVCLLKMSVLSNGPTLSFPEDTLPPERDYESRHALFKSINAWAETRGYAFTTGRSTKERSGKLTITYTCDRSCHSPDISKERHRKTTTRGTGCKFSVLAKESLDKSAWSLKHRLDKQFSLHNHMPSKHPSAHPVHRRLSTTDANKVSALSNAGVSPKDIRTFLHQNSDSLATQQDIYNQIAVAKREIFEGQSNINALASQMEKDGFCCRIQLAQDNRVTAVFFAHPDSLSYLKAYPDVLLLDCTYKTNKYKMPLLDIIGVDACQRSFCIAFAFLSGEAELDYSWALEHLSAMYRTCKARLPSVVLTDRCLACINAVAIHFPSAHSILCLWHANKAVLQHCQPAFMLASSVSSSELQTNNWKEFYQSWYSIIASPTEEVYKLVLTFGYFPQVLTFN